MKIDPQKRFGTRECPACACEVPANHNRCPMCGYEFLNPTPARRNLKWIGAVIMLAALIALILRAL